MIGLNSSIISFHHNPVPSGAADLLWPTDLNYLLRWLLLATFLISLTGIVLVLKKYYFFRIELWPMCPWLHPEGLEKIHKGRQVDPLFRIQTSSPYLFVRLHDCVCATYLSQAVLFIIDEWNDTFESKANPEDLTMWNHAGRTWDVRWEKVKSAESCL